MDCENCKFWEPGHTADSGNCRRHAPRFIQGQFQPTEDGYMPDRDAIWPRTAADDWCGDGEPRTDSKPGKVTG